MMTQDCLVNRELVSALADGQLRGEEFARTVEAVANAPDARAAWHAYHLMGDVLRSGELAAGGHDTAFVTRLQLRLQREVSVSPADVAAGSIAEPVHLTRARGISHREVSGANEPVLRWKRVAGFASLAAISAIGWNVVSGWGGQNGAPQLAQGSAASAVSVQPPVTLAGGEPQRMLRDPRLDELLAAHKQFGGASALQMPAGFLRNATFEGAAR